MSDIKGNIYHNISFLVLIVIGIIVFRNEHQIWDNFNKSFQYL